MAKEICISTTPHETRLAILEDDQLAEIYYERENEYTLAGSIYKGRVTRVLPGMQSSFVDVGLERDAFLYVTDFLEEQEDSDEYASEPSRREAARSEPARSEAPRRDVGPRAESGEEAHAAPERNGAEKNSGRRATPPAEHGHEGGRVGRERAREQAAAPLREAVPAAEDLEDKGDEESPAGTRRWRGRRGRRRGVRSGLPQADPRPAPTMPPTQTMLSETSEDEGDADRPVSFAEHGAPGGTAARPAATGPRSAGQKTDGAEPGASTLSEPRRYTPGRERHGRRGREPYAQASTFDRAARADRPAPSADSFAAEGASAEPTREPSRILSAPESVVLPGESLSKYGSAPATATPATALAPKAAARPVNYVASKPSTLVELTGDWDGGVLMPGESISRYKGERLASSSEALPPQSHSAEGSGGHDDEPADTGNHDQLANGAALAEQEDHGLSWQAVPEAWAPAPEAPQQPGPEAARELAQEPGQDTAPAPAEHDLVQEEPSLHAQPDSVLEPALAAQPEGEPSADNDGGRAAQGQSTALHTEGGPAPTIEPEIVAAALTPESEAETPAVAVRSEPAEYEPEFASASYRVAPVGASGLRVASPEELEEAVAPQLAPQQTQKTQPAHEAAAAEPVGHLADAPISVLHRDGATPSAEPVAEFGGELLSGAPGNSAVDLAAEEVHSAIVEPAPWPHTARELSDEAVDLTTFSPAEVPILHQDGTIDLAAAHQALAEDLHDSAAFHPELEVEEHEDRAPAFAPDAFTDLVDRLQGFSPGHGLLEEETIDEEEYDFEPIHAHADENDQEELEEETLDSTPGDARHEPHPEPAMQVQSEERHAELEASIAYPAEEEEEIGLGYEEVEEGEQDFEEGEGEEAPPSAQPGERAGRSEVDRERGPGRSGSRSGGRNGGRRNGAGRGRSAQSQDLPIISELLKQGQEILVQIAKEPIAKKGARITSHIALPGRFLVFMPTVSHVGVSRKIASDEERQRLKRILISEKGDSSGGFIVRTAAENATEEDLRADLRFLISLWAEIKQRADTAKAPALIYHDLNLIERILRDQVSSNFSTIWVDSEAEYERIIRFLSRFQPQLVRRVKLYTKETPLFEHFGIQEEISKALKSKVWLKSGGSIVINQTEALVAIDINTGKYVGKTSRLEDTIVKTNLDAIPEIVRQIRLRDLGGIIVIDFIDMDERKNRNRVLAALEEELKNDRAPSKVLQFNDFGLVAITRKRVKQSLERTLSVTCETCTGTGMVKSPITVCNEIYIEMRKMLKHLDGKDAMLRVHPEVVKQLKASNGKWINELEELAGKTIIIKSDAALHPEQFDIH